MELGICPNCLNQMTRVDYLAPKVKIEKGKIIKAKELTEPRTKYFCPFCEIISNDNENFNERIYTIHPNGFICELPTEKQKRTIYLINSKMYLGLRPLTKNQCSRDIGKYLEIAVDDSKGAFDDPIRLK